MAKIIEANIVPVDSGSHDIPPIVKVLNAHRGERHIIVLHDYPDPDAISAGFAHKLISTEFAIDTDIYYSGRISHRQNIAMVRLLGINLHHYDASLQLDRYDGAVFVDHQGATAETMVQLLEQANIPITFIVDHHEPQDRLKAEFMDVRQNVGSSATIYTQYLKQGLIELNKKHKEHVMLSTALIHGIKSDTGEFTRAKVEDYEAAAYLSQFSDADLLTQIMSQSRSRQVMEVIRRALGSRIAAQSYSVASIGYLRAEDRDAIPQAADFLLSEENIHTAIVYGIVLDDDRGETLIGSLRTSRITVDPDALLKQALGKDWAGHYYGGGKQSAGGFEIPIGFLAGTGSEEYKELKWKVYDSQIKHRLFTKLGIEQD